MGFDSPGLIHNHEVPSSILGPATTNKTERSNSVLFRIRVSAEKTPRLPTEPKHVKDRFASSRYILESSRDSRHSIFEFLCKYNTFSNRTFPLLPIASQ